LPITLRNDMQFHKKKKENSFFALFAHSSNANLSISANAFAPCWSNDNLAES